MCQRQTRLWTLHALWTTLFACGTSGCWVTAWWLDSTAESGCWMPTAMQILGSLLLAGRVHGWLANRAASACAEYVAAYACCAACKHSCKHSCNQVANRSCQVVQITAPGRQRGPAHGIDVMGEPTLCTCLVPVLKCNKRSLKSLSKWDHTGFLNSNAELKVECVMF